MPSGKPGDHPYTDIVLHGLDIYSERAAMLVREIASLVDDTGRRQLADLLLADYNEFAHPDIRELERVLAQMRDEARRSARDRGFEC